jgi:hypothetical protein
MDVITKSCMARQILVVKTQIRAKKFKKYETERLVRSVEQLSTSTNISKGGLVSHCIQGDERISECLSGLFAWRWLLNEILIRRTIGL